jgi:hypothetical protein
MTPLPIEFTFAGFNFPRYIPEIRRSSKYDKRTSRSIYYHAPKPLTAGPHPGRGFYLDNHGSPNRWKWADEISGASIRHTGWYSDEYGDAEKIRGVVIYLPHGRMLAGWSMGEGMASSIDGDIYTDEIEAARAADSIAEAAAEQEREYQAEIEEERRQEEHNQGDDAEETEGY